MITRTALALALAAPATAIAGVGLTVQIPTGTAFESFFVAYYSYYYGGATYLSGLYPSLDVRAGDVVVQIHAVETLVALSTNDVYLGANAFAPIATASLGGAWEAFASAGGSLDALLVSEYSETSIGIGPIMPVGVRVGDEARVAVYGVLGLNVVSAGDLAVLGEGSLNASVWF